MKSDPVHRKILKAKDAFVDEDDFDPDEALTAAIKKRKFLSERLLEDRQYTFLRAMTMKMMMMMTMSPRLMN